MSFTIFAPLSTTPFGKPFAALKRGVSLIGTKELFNSLLLTKQMGLTAQFSNDWPIMPGQGSIVPFDDLGRMVHRAEHEMDIIDKHKLLIPTGDYAQGLTTMIRQIAPDFPHELGNAGFSSCIFQWVARNILPHNQLGIADPSARHIFERELDISVGIILQIGTLGPLRPLIPTLNALVDTARETIRLMRDGAASY
jgi:hypothetical protein